MAKKKPAAGQLWTDKKRTFLGLPWSFTRYILTEKKLITQRGFFTVIEDEVELYRIVDKSLKRTLWQRIFKLGTVILNCRDSDTPVKEVLSVKRPREFMDLLEQQIDIQRDKYNIRGRDIIHSECDHDCDNV